MDSGLSGTGRLHDLFVKIEGMTPGEYQNQGYSLNIKYSFCESQFGKYLIASTDKGICYLHFFDLSEEEILNNLKITWNNAQLIESTDQFQNNVALFFNHHYNTINEIKLHLKATPFQINVWKALLKIPSAGLNTYGQIAKNINMPNASRAVGTAIGANQIALIIPCHRVIKSTGDFGEFRWGSTRKKSIIGWEACKSNTTDI